MLVSAESTMLSRRERKTGQREEQSRYQSTVESKNKLPRWESPFTRRGGGGGWNGFGGMKCCSCSAGARRRPLQRRYAPDWPWHPRGCRRRLREEVVGSAGSVFKGIKWPSKVSTTSVEGSTHLSTIYRVISSLISFYLLIPWDVALLM
jgi:hypothetical protein